MEMRAVYAACLAEMMEQDHHVVVLDADLSKASGTRSLYERFPNQIFECGIAEQDMTSIAAGMASYGFKPWIESFATFASRRICDQITLSVAYAGQNVKIVGTDPGITAELNGGTHMALEDIGTLRSIPGLVITEPADETQLRRTMAALNDYEGPAYLRLFRKELPHIFDEDYEFDLFKADTLKTGKDLTICVSGFQTRDVLDAEKTLAAEGIGIAVCPELYLNSNYVASGTAGSYIRQLVEVCPLFDDSLSDTIAIGYNKDRYCSKTAESFIRLCLEKMHGAEYPTPFQGTPAEI